MKQTTIKTGYGTVKMTVVLGTQIAKKNLPPRRKMPVPDLVFPTAQMDNAILTMVVAECANVARAKPVTIKINVC